MGALNLLKVPHIRYRLKRRVRSWFGDVELRQLRSLERAYDGATGPELLIFGDSAMFWTSPHDSDQRHLAEMVRDEISSSLRIRALVGPGYNPRIIMAYLTALPTCRSRPKVVIVPTSMLMASNTWLSHPHLGYSEIAPQIRDAVTNGRKDRPRRLERLGPEALNEYDKQPANSLFGARRTLGELRLIANAPPVTQWQKIIRLRHLMDYSNAERLEPDSEGVTLISEMSKLLIELSLPAVAYIPPVNHEVIRKTLGEAAVEHVRRNSEVVEAAFDGTVVNAAFDSPSEEFADPLHLSDAGRRRLAGRIADVVRPLLDASL